MTAHRTEVADSIAELLKVEEERCRALNEQDWPALEALLAPQYFHVHSSGMVQDRETYVAYMKTSPRITRRGELAVNVYGDAAVMTGPLFREGGPGGPQVSNLILQVWIRQEAGWQTVAFQSTSLPAAKA